MQLRKNCQIEIDTHDHCILSMYAVTTKLIREFIEGLDLFVGRYLVLIASGYIILKFVHFKSKKFLVFVLP